MGVALHVDGLPCSAVKRQVCLWLGAEAPRWQPTLTLLVGCVAGRVANDTVQVELLC